MKPRLLALRRIARNRLLLRAQAQMQAQKACKVWQEPEATQPFRSVQPRIAPEALPAEPAAELTISGEGIGDLALRKRAGTGTGYLHLEPGTPEFSAKYIPAPEKTIHRVHFEGERPVHQKCDVDGNPIGEPYTADRILVPLD